MFSVNKTPEPKHCNLVPGEMLFCGFAELKQFFEKRYRKTRTFPYYYFHREPPKCSFVISIYSPTIFRYRLLVTRSAAPSIFITA